MKLSNGLASIIKGFLALFFLLEVSILSASGEGWEMNFPIPGDDPRWQRVAGMWETHWDGRNIDAMLDLCHQLETDWPDRIEPLLWLGRLYYQKGQFEMKKRAKYHKKAEAYANKAHARDKDNLLALFILVHAVISRPDHDAVMGEYGGWIRAVVPLPTGKDLPDMPPSTEWNQAMTLWKDRFDIQKLEEATAIISKIAGKTPKDALAQLWAGYAFHTLGAYYSFKDQPVEKGVLSFKEASDYLKKSLDIAPYSVPAHYWLQLSLARRVEQSNVVTQALFLKPIMDHLLFCIRENALYDSGGPVYIVATMIIEAGWVCKKGMEMAGYTVDMVMLALEICEILYPDQYYIPYIRASLINKGYKKPGEAIIVLEQVLKKGPPLEGDPHHIEKTINYNRVKRLHEKLESLARKRK